MYKLLAIPVITLFYGCGEAIEGTDLESSESSKSGDILEESPTILVETPTDSEVSVDIRIERDGNREGSEIRFSGWSSSNSVLYSWHSTIDGVFGKGAILKTDKLSAGLHTITLTVTDSSGNSFEESKDIEIFPAEDVSYDMAPVANITVEKSRFYSDEVVRFDSVGSYDDDYIVEYRWSSDIDGLLGFGEVLNVKDMQVGKHSVTLSVKDSGGTVTKSVEVIEIVENIEFSGVPNTPVPTAGKYRVEVEVKVTGNNWDIGGNAPDVEVYIEIGDQEFSIPKKQDSYTVKRVIEGVEIEEDTKIYVEAVDRDLTSDDYIGNGSFNFGLQNQQIVNLSGNGTATFRFFKE